MGSILWKLRGQYGHKVVVHDTRQHPSRRRVEAIRSRDHHPARLRHAGYRLRYEGSCQPRPDNARVLQPLEFALCLRQITTHNIGEWCWAGTGIFARDQEHAIADTLRRVAAVLGDLLHTEDVVLPE